MSLGNTSTSGDEEDACSECCKLDEAASTASLVSIDIFCAGAVADRVRVAPEAGQAYNASPLSPSQRTYELTVWWLMLLADATAPEEDGEADDDWLLLCVREAVHAVPAVLCVLSLASYDPSHCSSSQS